MLTQSLEQPQHALSQTAWMQRFVLFFSLVLVLSLTMRQTMLNNKRYEGICHIMQLEYSSVLKGGGGLFFLAEQF